MAAQDIPKLRIYKSWLIYNRELTSDSQSSPHNRALTIEYSQSRTHNRVLTMGLWEWGTHNRVLRIGYSQCNRLWQSATILIAWCLSVSAPRTPLPDRGWFNSIEFDQIPMIHWSFPTCEYLITCITELHHSILLLPSSSSQFMFCTSKRTPSSPPSCEEGAVSRKLHLARRSSPALQMHPCCSW